jgi:hypothetical protein
MEGIKHPKMFVELHHSIKKQNGELYVMYKRQADELDKLRGMMQKMLDMHPKDYKDGREGVYAEWRKMMAAALAKDTTIKEQTGTGVPVHNPWHADMAVHLKKADDWQDQDADVQPEKGGDK